MTSRPFQMHDDRDDEKNKSDNEEYLFVCACLYAWWERPRECLRVRGQSRNRFDTTLETRTRPKFPGHIEIAVEAMQPGPYGEQENKNERMSQRRRAGRVSARVSMADLYAYLPNLFNYGETPKSSCTKCWCQVASTVYLSTWHVFRSWQRTTMTHEPHPWMCIPSSDS